MNVRTFLIGALCGAVVFSILDRLMEERERRLAAREADSRAADVRSEPRPLELQPAVTPAPIPGSVEHPVASAGAVYQGVETVEPTAAGGNQPAQLPRGPASADAAARDEPKDSKRGVDGSSSEGASAAVLPDDPAWGPYMEQTLRQFLASHRNAPQFDVLSIKCISGLCEIRAVGFDESTEPVWQQVVYDIRQQPWAEFGQTGTSSGLTDGRFVLTARLFRQPPK